MSHRDLSIKVDPLTRVEGEGALEVEVADGQVRALRLRIYEPPRLFEQLVVGRPYQDVPDIVARICGICPVAYQMSALHALEQILQVQVDPAIRRLRRLFYCGEWIESHVLHMVLLAAPDFLGYESALEMAQDHEEWVRRGLRLKQVGNDIVELLGGRSIHPVSPRVGGFSRIPEPRVLRERLLPALEQAREDARALLEGVSGFSWPQEAREVEFVALWHPEWYPMNEGQIRSTHGLDLPVFAYEEAFQEIQVPHSHALHSVIRGRGSYVVGPLARVNLNRDRLHPAAQEALAATGIPFPNTNLFTSIVARAAEVLHAVEEAREILLEGPWPTRPYVEAPSGPPEERWGCWITEAPRGMLYHAYRLDPTGTVLDCKIVPPTSQNLRAMEEELRSVLPALLDQDLHTLTHHCEARIRNYDPCISCSTHFLRVDLRRVSRGPGAEKPKKGGHQEDRSG